MAFKKKPMKRKMLRRRSMKISIPEGTVIEYKNLDLLRKFLTDRGKMLARRLTGISAPQQREMTRSIKRARYLGLLPAGSSKRK